MRRKRFATDARAAALAFVATAFVATAFPASAVPTVGPAVVPTVGLAVVSGDRQSARAFAASTGPGYETPYPQPLVVRVVPSRRVRAMRRSPASPPLVLRFTCISRDCRFAASEQGDDVTRVSPQAYDVRVANGRATLPPTLSTDRVPGVFVVRVTVSPRANVRADRDAVFHLVVR